MAVIYLHLGLSKTGSTFLQKDVFPLLQNFNYLCKPRVDVGINHAKGFDLDYITGEKPGVMVQFFKGSPVIWEDLGDELFSGLFAPKSERPHLQNDVLLSDLI